MKNANNVQDKITTTLAQIRAHKPCEGGWKKLCKSLGGLRVYGEDTPLTFKQIYDSNGYEDTLWCLRAVDKKYYPVWRHFAIDCAEGVKHLMTDGRSLNALAVARKHADGKATDVELAVAWDAAWAAARAAAGAGVRDTAWDAARDAAWAGAWAAAWAAVRDAAWDAAWDAARAAAGAAARAAAGAGARAAARAVAWAAARDAARDAQIKLLFQFCRTGERVKK